MTFPAAIAENITPLACFTNVGLVLFLGFAMSLDWSTLIFSSFWGFHGMAVWKYTFGYLVFERRDADNSPKMHRNYVDAPRKHQLPFK